MGIDDDLLFLIGFFLGYITLHCKGTLSDLEYNVPLAQHIHFIKTVHNQKGVPWKLQHHRARRQCGTPDYQAIGPHAHMAPHHPVGSLGTVLQQLPANPGC